LGRDAKLSWEKNSDITTVRGGRWSQAIHEADDGLISQRTGGSGRWNNTQNDF
jgi:hypothetical protein